MHDSTILYQNADDSTIVLEQGSRGLTGATGIQGPAGPATTDASLLTSGTLNTNRLPATGIFTTGVQAKETSATYPAAQIVSTGKIWSQPSNFPPYMGVHNNQYVGYGSDTQVYIERSEPTAHILTVKMNRFQAIASEQAQVTSGSFPASGSTITLADASAFPNSANSGTLFYEQISDDLTTTGPLSASWTNRTPYGSPLSRFTVTSTGAYCTFADGPSIATVSTGELSHEVTCRFSGTLQSAMGIVVRYNDLGSGSASWISLRYNSTYAQIDAYGFFRSTGGTVTGTYIGQTETFGFVSGMYVKAIVDSDKLAVYTGVVDDQNEIQYSTPRTFTLTDSNLLLGTNAGLVQHGTTVSTTERYTDFSVRAKKSFTYTGKSGSSLTGVTCATTKTFTADSTTFVTYTDLSAINLITAVDSIGAVIWRLKNMGGQHTTDNITMGGNDDGGEIGLAFQSDLRRNESGLVFFGDSAPSGTPNASGNRGTFLRRVGARLIRSGGRLHIAPSDITNYAGTATGDGTPAAPHLSIGNIDTGLYLTTSGTDTLRVSVDGTNVASFNSTGITSSFVGNLTGNASGSAATVTGAAQTAITSVGTLSALRVDGNFGIGVSGLAQTGLRISKNISGSAFAQGIFLDGAIQPSVTSRADMIWTAPTVAASVTLPTLQQFYATVGGIGAGSTITASTGFYAESNIGNPYSGTITNAYGFLGNIASGTGRYNLYMQGTAANYMAGRLGVGAILTSGAMAIVQNTTAGDKAFIVKGAASQSGDFFDVQNSGGTSQFKVDSSGAVGIGNTPAAGRSFVLGKSMTGSIAPIGLFSSGQIQSDATNSANYFNTFVSTAAAAFTCATAIHYKTQQGTIGAGSSIGTQVGFLAESSLIGATTNNLGFWGAIPADANKNYNLYMSGTAPNYMAGNLGVGVTVPTQKLDVAGNIALTGSVIFEGATADNFETTLAVTDPTVDRTITLPNASGTVALVGTQTVRSITTSTDTPTSTDLGNLLTIDTTSGAVTVTINSSLGLTAGQRIDFVWIGAATSVTFSASSVTLNGTPGLNLRARYSAATLVCTASNTYVLVGDLSA